MNVFVANEQELEVDVARASDLARHTLTHEKVDEEAELSVLYVTEEHMRKLNGRFAGNDYVTDVLAFPLMEDNDDPDETVYLLGDVVICPKVAAENAAKIGHDLATELDTLVVHGTLHLLGYDHQGDQDKAKMDRCLRNVLESFGEPA